MNYRHKRAPHDSPYRMTIESLELRQLLAGVPAITEIMAANSGFLVDGDCNSPDWIEIQNVGDTAIDLAGHRLTDTPAELSRWVFPSVTLAPSEFLLVFASGREEANYVDAGGNLHTNFGLSRDGEYLALVAPDGTILSQYGTPDTDYPEQSANISYGVVQNGPDEKVGFISTPTPGAENLADIFTGIVGRTQINGQPGFHDAPIAVTISNETPDAEIRYTTDGRPPTATNGTLYSDPIEISTTTILRASAFKDGHIPSAVETQTYLFLQDVIRQPENPPGLPTTWKDSFPDDGMDYPAEYGMDPRIVDHPDYSDEIVDSLTSIRTMSIVTDPDNLFGPDGLYNNTALRGLETEKPVSVEIINTDGTLAYQGNAGLRNHADFFRRFSITVKQSLRLSFRSQYGPTQMEYRLFPDSPAEQFDSIVLQSTKIVDDDPGMIRNSFARDTNLAMGNLEAHATYVHLYLNGLYWGLYNPFERPDSQFAERYLGGRDKDYDAMNHNDLSTLHARPDEAVDGDVTRYNAMLDHIRTGFETKEAFEELERQVDLNSLFDVLLIQHYTADNEHESKQVGSRIGDPNFRYFVWDMDEKGLSSVRARINFREYLPRRVFDSLVGNPETLLRFADRAHKHLFNGGALTPEAVAERWGNRADEIRSAVVAETARWGDTHHRSVVPRRPIERDREWQRELDFLTETYFPERTQVMIDQLRSLGYYPSIDAPRWNQFGGAVSTDFQLAMTNPGGTGTIHYTLDGSDPRQHGGDISANAIVYDGNPVAITEDTVVKSRILSGDEWSALSEGEFVVVGPDSPFHLRIAEINYRPYDANSVPGVIEPGVDKSQFEFIELVNTGAAATDISGVQLTRDVQFTFPAGTTLASGERVLLVNNRAAFESRYGTGLNIVAEFDFKLVDGRGVIDLRDASDRRIQLVSYDSQDPWPQRANGLGSSLELTDLSRTASDPSSWRVSSEFGGSPGVTGSGAVAPVTITEVLANSQSPASGMVELHNSSAGAIDIGNWYFSNSADDYFRYQIPSGVSIPSGGHHVLSETEFGFGLNGDRGDQLWLVEADTSGKPLRFADHVQFGASAAGVSMGPGPGIDGTWLPLAEPTFGSTNSGLLFGDVIISEINYAPLDPDGDSRLLRANDFEYIELYNRTDSARDISGWRITGGVEVTLPANTILDTGQSLLVIPFDPGDRAKAPVFRVVHGVAQSVQLVGPYSEPLEDAGDIVRLERPGLPPANEPNFTPTLYVDEVAYEAVAPWPEEAAAGMGPSLTRISPTSFGNSASSWIAKPVSPGTVDIVVRLPGDANEDGRFDQLDLVQVLQAGKYQTQQPATFGQGDWNGDGLFNQLDLVAALQTGSYLGPSAAISSGVKSSKVSSENNLEELDRLLADFDR